VGREARKGYAWKPSPKRTPSGIRRKKRAKTYFARWISGGGVTKSRVTSSPPSRKSWIRERGKVPGGGQKGVPERAFKSERGG